MYKEFLAQLKKDLEEGKSPQELEVAAWAWFDSKKLPLNQENKLRRELDSIFGNVSLEDQTPKPRFTNLQNLKHYPTDGWIPKYMKYASFCAAPPAFHFFCGLGVLATAIGRNAWIPFGRNNCFGAIYVVLIAPPGQCFKSTAIEIATDIARDLKLREILNGRATPEAISDILSTTEGEPIKDACALVSAPELFRFLAGHNTPANNQIVAALTSWYDCAKEDDDITITRKRRKIHNIAITLLGGSTLDWLVESLPKHVFAGGFMSRVLFVHQEATGPVHSMSPPEDVLQRMEVLEDLNDIIDKFKGPMEMSSEAFEVYDKWFVINHAKLIKSDERTADFMVRRPDYVRKVSLLLAASRLHTAIELIDIQQAISILDLLDPALEAIITPISLGDNGKELDVVRRTIEKYGEISRVSLVRKCSARGIAADQLSRIIDTLYQANLVDEETSGQKGGRIYRWLGK